MIMIANFMSRSYLPPIIPLHSSNYRKPPMFKGANVYGSHRLEYNIQGSLAVKVVFFVQVTAGWWMVSNLCALRIWPRIIPEAVSPGDLGGAWHKIKRVLSLGIFTMMTSEPCSSLQCQNHRHPLPLACSFHWRSHSGVSDYQQKKQDQLRKAVKKWNCTLTFLKRIALFWIYNCFIISSWRIPKSLPAAGSNRAKGAAVRRVKWTLWVFKMGRWTWNCGFFPLVIPKREQRGVFGMSLLVWRLFGRFDAHFWLMLVFLLTSCCRMTCVWVKPLFGSLQNLQIFDGNLLTSAFLVSSLELPHLGSSGFLVK